MPFKMHNEKIKRKFKVSIRQGCREIRKEVKRLIRNARKAGINLVIYSVESQKQHLIFELEENRIGRLKKVLRKKPKKLTLLEILHFQDSVKLLILKREREINKLFKGKYKIELITQIMQEGEVETLVILLAKRIK